MHSSSLKWHWILPSHHFNSAVKTFIQSTVRMIPHVFEQVGRDVLIRCAMHPLEFVLGAFPKIFNVVGVNARPWLDEVNGMVDRGMR